MTTTSTLRRLVPAALVLLATLPRSRAQETIGPEPPLTAEAVAALEDFIGRELESNAIPALSIALVDGDRIVWARGFGLADPVGLDPGDGRDGLPRRLRLEAVHRPGRDAARRVRRARPRRAGLGLPARLPPGQPVRRAGDAPAC